MLRIGDEAGLRHFMSHFGDSLRFFAFKITKNKELSEEIVSETFYKLWQRREKAESTEWVKSFVYLVTRNACYNYTGSLAHKTIVFGDEEMSDVADVNSDILTQIIYVELIEQIVGELKNMPEQQAAVFRLSYLEGMDTREICEALGTTASTVYFAKSKALSTLRMIFKEKDISLYIGLLLLIR